MMLLMMTIVVMMMMMMVVGGYDDDNGDDAGGYDADDHEYDHDGSRSDFKCFLFFLPQEKELIMLIRKLKMRNAIQILQKASSMELR